MERVLVPGGPSPLVLEQDFILQLRRLQRLGTRALAINIFLSKAPVAQEPGQREALQDKLQHMVETRGGKLHLLTNGDAFAVMPRSGGDEAHLANRILHDLFGSDEGAGRSLHALHQIYTMPEQYNELRERLNAYMDEIKAMDGRAALGPAQQLQAEDVRGPLTAYSLSQIERLIDQTDLTKYMRTQSVYEQLGDGSWVPFFEENYVGVSELAREKFPRLEVVPNSRLFMELCAKLDRRILTDMLKSVNTWGQHTISLNLTASTVLSSSFAQFCHVVSGARRSLVCFELNCRDLLQDFDLTKNAIRTMRQEGFRIALDAVTPDLLPYFRFTKFNPDYIKLMVDRNHVAQLQDDDVIRALKNMTRSTIIFAHCDSRVALDAGLALGITKFQGFYVDEHIKVLRGAQ